MLSRVANQEASLFLELLKDESSASVLTGEKSLKPLVLTALGNMFTQYMCSTRFGYDDENFTTVIRIFDEIFWDINQGYAVDFLPWLGPFYSGHMRRINGWASDVRSFILKRIIEHRRETLDMENGVPRDFTDALLLHLESEESDLSWEHIIFELEDFLGGHSAVGNLVMLILANVVIHPGVQGKIQKECDDILEKSGRPRESLFTLDDTRDMPYSEAVIWETLRMASSPIVPHVATRDTEIGGYSVSKDSVIFINNFGLNLGEDFWGPDARKFVPERFLKMVADVKTGEKMLKVVKPEIFVPFSTGKRTCIGQRLVQGCAFILVTAMVSQFDISCVDEEELKCRLRPGCVATPVDSIHLALKPRMAPVSEEL